MNITNLRGVAELSEPCLLAVAHALGKARDAEGMLSLLGLLSQSGFPGRLTGEDLWVDLQSIDGKESLRLSDSILECLKSNATGTVVLDVFITLHQRHGSDVRKLVNDLLFRSARVARGDLVHKLIGLGAEKDVEHASHTFSGLRFTTPYEECLLEGNAEQAIAYVRTDRPTAKEMAWAIARGQKGKGKSTEYPEAVMLITVAMNFSDIDANGSLARLLKAFDEAIGVAITRTVRARLLAILLNVAQHNLTSDRLAQVDYLLEKPAEKEKDDPMWLRLQRLAVKTRCLELSDIVANHAVSSNSFVHTLNKPGRRFDAHLT